MLRRGRWLGMCRLPEHSCALALWATQVDAASRCSITANLSAARYSMRVPAAASRAAALRDLASSRAVVSDAKLIVKKSYFVIGHKVGRESGRHDAQLNRRPWRLGDDHNCVVYPTVSHAHAI